MSALGHKRTFRIARAVSALPQKADIRQCSCMSALDQERSCWVQSTSSLILGAAWIVRGVWTLQVESTQRQSASYAALVRHYSGRPDLPEFVTVSTDASRGAAKVSSFTLRETHQPCDARIAPDDARSGELPIRLAYLISITYRSKSTNQPGKKRSE